MRFIKLAIISFAVLFFIVTAIGLLFPSTVRVSRAADIAAPQDSIAHLLTDVKYWKLWLEGAKENPIQFLTPKTAGQGTVAQIGTNEVSLLSITPSQIVTQWKGKDGVVQQSGFELYADSLKQIVTVQWYFEQHLNWYTWERFGSMMNDKILGPTMEKSLENLKQLAEK